MINTVLVSKDFQRDAKRLLKKFHTLRNSIDKLIEDLTVNPYLGDPYGNKLYKVGYPIKAKAVVKAVVLE